MSKYQAVKLFEFIFLLDEARGIHHWKSEPIPDLSDSQQGKIEGVLQLPFQTGFGQMLYPGFYKKAAILFYCLIKNHILSNGNKRMALLTTAYFAHINGYFFDLNDQEWYDLAIESATSTDKDQMLLRIETVLRRKCYNVEQRLLKRGR